MILRAQLAPPSSIQCSFLPRFALSSRRWALRKQPCAPSFALSHSNRDLALVDHSFLRYFCRFVLSGADIPNGSAQASIDSFWKLFPATSSAGSSYMRTLLSKNEEIECAAYLQSSARSFKRLTPGYSTLGQQLTADDAAATVTLCLVFHDEVFRCSVCPRCNCFSVEYCFRLPDCIAASQP